MSKKFYKGRLVVTRENAKVGELVVRGPDWSWGNQDTECGNTEGIGKIIEIRQHPFLPLYIEWLKNSKPFKKYNSYHFADLCYYSPIKFLLEAIKED